MDYKDTPSFYNNEEFFNKYLKKTSYYLNLQNVVEKLIGLLQPKKVLELGSALGTTSMILAEKYKDIRFEGCDLRDDVVLKANEAAKKMNNVDFFVSDMVDIAKKPLSEYDFIFMLYSFHHISDPEDNKISFLRNSYKNMKRNSYLLILETFLPEKLSSIKNNNDIINLWEQRAKEGYASTYWATLNDLSNEGIKFAKNIALTSQKEESEAGRHVYNRNDEYLVKFSWLEKKADEIGFNIIIAEPVNCLEEKAILLKK